MSRTDCERPWRAVASKPWRPSSNALISEFHLAAPVSGGRDAAHRHQWTSVNQVFYVSTARICQGRGGLQPTVTHTAHPRCSTDTRGLTYSSLFRALALPPPLLAIPLLLHHAATTHIRLPPGLLAVRPGRGRAEQSCARGAHAEPIQSSHCRAYPGSDAGTHGSSHPRADEPAHDSPNTGPYTR